MTVNMMGVIGIVVVLISVLLIGSLILLLGSLVIIKKKQKMILPRCTLFLARLGENFITRTFEFIGFGTEWIVQALIDLKNFMSLEEFKKTPYNKRIIFIPQCVRHRKCPAKSDYDGLHCIQCNQCGIGELKKEVEGMGYKFFIAPGSSLVKRMTVKHKPKAAIGLGCLFEIKEFLQLMSKLNVASQGIVLETSGCIETVFNNEKLLKCIKQHN